MKKGWVLGLVVGILFGLALTASAANVFPPVRVSDEAVPGACYKLVEQGVADAVQRELSGYLNVLQDGEIDGTMGHVVGLAELSQEFYDSPTVCPPAPRTTR